MKHLLLIATLILFGCQSHPLISNRKVECNVKDHPDNIWWRRPVYKTPDPEWDKFNGAAPVPSDSVAAVSSPAVLKGCSCRELDSKADEELKKLEELEQLEEF